MKHAWPAAILGVLSLAAALRLPQLADRPMHADEAVLADKFGTLLETGVYDYDPRDYHGPVLLYATLVSSRLRGIARYADLDEQALRIVPVFFGLLLAALPLLLARALGRAEALAAAGLTAVSPAMVYYSRYYIPEMLLVCFLFGVIAFGYLYARSGRARWAILAGACLGLAFAAKETAVLAVLAMAAALALTTRKLGAYRVLALGVGAAVVVFVLAITSFFREPGAVAEYIQAFAGYLGRGFGAGPHVHPWHYYAGLTLRCEALVAVLAAVGAVAAWKRRDARLLRFLLWYTVVLTVLYSVIPYKTPWCILSPLSGMLLLAGAGLVALFRARKVVFAAVAAAGLLQMYAVGSSPYVYSQTSRDVYAIRSRLEALAAAHPAGRAMPVAVFSKENLWPLPWYLRSFASVEWWTGVPRQKPSAPVLLVSPAIEPALARALYETPPPGERELYVNIFDGDVELRPQVELRGYAAKSLWDRAGL
ncbi:MAG: flippase activity-associated protein Agl23 [Rhodospirillales bacterium]